MGGWRCGLAAARYMQDQRPAWLCSPRPLHARGRDMSSTSPNMAAMLISSAVAASTSPASFPIEPVRAGSSALFLPLLGFAGIAVQGNGGDLTVPENGVPGASRGTRASICYSSAISGFILIANTQVSSRASGTITPNIAAVRGPDAARVAVGRFGWRQTRSLDPPSAPGPGNRAPREGSELVQKERKAFFSEEKQQKTFASADPGRA